MNIAAVVLHYRDLQATRACLASLGRIAAPSFSVILIDNGSGDGSGEQLRESIAAGRMRIGRSDWPDWLIPTQPGLDGLPPGVACTRSPCGRLLFLASPVNLGFAGGNNLGIRFAATRGADYFWLLNADTVVTRSALAGLVRTAGSGPRTGAVQSLLLCWGDRRRVDASGQIITAAGVRNDRSRPPRGAGAAAGIPIFGACAASVLYDAAALRDVGLFDEEFYVICEDVDLSFRLQLSGYRLLLSPRSVVFHKGGITTPGFRDDPVKIFFGYRNEWLIALRYLGWRHLFTPRSLYHALQASAAGRRIGQRFLPLILRNLREGCIKVGEKRALRKRWGG